MVISGDLGMSITVEARSLFIMRVGATVVKNCLMVAKLENTSHSRLLS